MAKSKSRRQGGRKSISLYNIIIIIVVLGIASAAIASYYNKNTCTEPTTPEPTTSTSTSTTLQLSPIPGSLIIAVKDSYKLAGGYTILGINLTIDNVSIDEPGACCNMSEWRLISGYEKTVGLLDYTDTRAVIAEIEMYEEDHSKIQLSIGSADITVKNDLMYLYRGRTYPLILSTNPIDLEYNFTVKEGKTTALILDFEIEDSIVKNSEGFTLTPKITISEETLDIGEELPKSELIQSAYS